MDLPSEEELREFEHDELKKYVRDYKVGINPQESLVEEDVGVQLSEGEGHRL